MAKIQVPTLIIHGDEDPIALPRDAKELSHSIPGAQLIMMPNMGHMLFNRDLESKIANMLVQFLNSNSSNL